MHKYLIGAVIGALAIAALGVGLAAAATKGGVTFETKYTSTKPGTSTGFRTRIKGAPRDAQNRLEAATKVTVRFHPGTKFNTSVPANCKRATLVDTGKCSSRSRVGTGKAEAVSGLAAIDPVKENIVAYNTRNGILFYLTPGSPGGQTLVLPGRISGRTLTTTVPPFPVPGNPKGAVLTKFNLDIKAKSKGRGSNRKDYVRTPTTCAGRWTNSATFAYSTVQAIKNILSRTLCKKS